jgi:drug/metabolite transporter (DMT)-like permease
VVVNPGLSFIGLGLAAAAFWGASDFLGGLATRKAYVVGVVAVAHSLSLGLLLLAALATHSPLPPERYALLGLCAGTFGGMALILYYQALSLGAMGITTALTGLLTALVPVVYSFITQGSPKSTQIAGFVLAAAAIGLIAYAPAGLPHPLALGLASIAGVAFGVFLVVLKVGSAHSLLWQLIFSRVASATLAVGIVIGMQLRRGKRGTSWRKQPRGNHFWWLAGSAGVLEAAGSLLYMRAAHEGRLDVAAVLASLYPVVTIVLAAWFLKERTTSSQTLGMALALGAVVLVSI